MKRFTMLLAGLVAAMLGGGAHAQVSTTWTWSPSPRFDAQGNALPPPSYYEVFVSMDGQAEILAATVQDTVWNQMAVPGVTYVLRVRAVDDQGRASPMSEASAPWTAPAHSGVPSPPTLAVGPAVPNPFNPATSIAYSLPVGAGGPVSLCVLDARGRFVKTLPVDPTPGDHAARWDGTDESGAAVAAGVYMVQLRCGPEMIMTKLTMLK